MQKSLREFLTFCEGVCAAATAARPPAGLPAAAPAGALPQPAPALSAPAAVPPTALSQLSAGAPELRDMGMGDTASLLGDTYFDADFSGAALQVGLVVVSMHVSTQASRHADACGCANSKFCFDCSHLLCLFSACMTSPSGHGLSAVIETQDLTQVVLNSFCADLPRLPWHVLQHLVVHCLTHALLISSPPSTTRWNPRPVESKHWRPPCFSLASA